MSKRKGKLGRGRDDFVDDARLEGSAPAKKAFKRTSHHDDDGIVVCELSGRRRLSVKLWRGKVFVDIREYYTKDGKDLPGKKGISLSLDQWQLLRDNMDAVDKAIESSG